MVRTIIIHNSNIRSIQYIIYTSVSNSAEQREGKLLHLLQPVVIDQGKCDTGTRFWCVIIQLHSKRWYAIVICTLWKMKF